MTTRLIINNISQVLTASHYSRYVGDVKDFGSAIETTRYGIAVMLERASNVELRIIILEFR